MANIKQERVLLYIEAFTCATSSCKRKIEEVIIFLKG